MAARGLRCRVLAMISWRGSWHEPYRRAGSVGSDAGSLDVTFAGDLMRGAVFLMHALSGATRPGGISASARAPSAPSDERLPSGPPANGAVSSPQRRPART